MTTTRHLEKEIDKTKWAHPVLSEHSMHQFECFSRHILVSFQALFIQLRASLHQNNQLLIENVTLDEALKDLPNIRL